MKNIASVCCLIILIYVLHFAHSDSNKLSRVKRGFLDKVGQIALVGLGTMTGDSCAVRKFWSAYWDIHSLNGNCDRCDKYFHCRANYDAVHGCMREDPYGSYSQRMKTAKRISQAREFGQAGQDSEDDERANRFGREGGDCAKEYLGIYGCNYDPWTKTCNNNNNNNIKSKLMLTSLRGFLTRRVEPQTLPSYGFYANSDNQIIGNRFGHNWKWPDK